MQRIVFDIETVANDKASDFINHFKEVKAPGNYKDPDKIKAYVRQAKKELLNKAGLDPNTGKVCAIGYQRLRNYEKIGEPQFLHGTDEKQVIVDFFKLVDGAKHLGDVKLYAWCGPNSFDYDFLAKRGRNLNVGLPEIWRDRYSKIDLMNLNVASRGYEKLTEAAYCCGLDPKENDGSAVQGWYNEGNWAEMKKYNMHEIDLMANIVARSKPFNPEDY